MKGYSDQDRKNIHLIIIIHYDECEPVREREREAERPIQSIGIGNPNNHKLWSWKLNLVFGRLGLSLVIMYHELHIAGRVINLQPLIWVYVKMNYTPRIIIIHLHMTIVRDGVYQLTRY